MNGRIFQASSLLAFIFVNFCYSPALGQPTTVLSVNKKIVKGYFDEVINTQKLNRMGDFFAQDFIWHQMDGKDTHSSQDSSHISTLRWLYLAIPDVEYHIDHIVADGDMVAVNTTGTGTAKSEMFGFAADQKKVRFKQMFFFRLTNNKITEEWEVVDTRGLVNQLKQ